MRDAEYYERRERLEHELAAKAHSDTVRDIHLGFAKRYANLAAAKKGAQQSVGSTGR
jgi:hypothetical protein